MKIRARFSETGTLIDLRDEEQWARAHPGTNNPRLFCGEAGCNVRLFASERTNHTRGTITRFFKFGRNSPRCTHEEDGAGVEVPDPATAAPPQGQGGGGPMTDEHQWLVDFVVSEALKAGFEPLTEHRLEGGAIADIFVPRACRARVEVQRVDTNIADRTQRHDDVVWLLRNPSGDKYVFDHPAVKILCSRWLKSPGGKGNWVPAEPWRKDRDFRCSIKAATTVFTPREIPTSNEFFGTRPIPLSQFLNEVWTGQRRWYRRGEVHKFAGWALNEDHEKYQRWHAAKQLVRRTVTEPPSRPAAPVKAPHPQTQPTAAPTILQPPKVPPAPPQLPQTTPTPLPALTRTASLRPAGPLTTEERIAKLIESHFLEIFVAAAVMLVVMGILVYSLQS